MPCRNCVTENYLIYFFLKMHQVRMLKINFENVTFAAHKFMSSQTKKLSARSSFNTKVNDIFGNLNFVFSNNITLKFQNKQSYYKSFDTFPYNNPTQKNMKRTRRVRLLNL